MTKKALVIDDNELVRDTLKAMLEFLDFEVAVAKNGEEALEKFKSSDKPFDVVFVDLVMPGISGIEVMQKIREISSQVKAIISSGYSNNSSITEYEKIGFKGILNKPYTLDELKEILKKLNIL
ncbi:response regulator receiver domain-containing protein [Thermodesulfovibrio aggregans]|uniref:Response regulator receiver domain-containing protein n=1 Tax=Thermodesulfovibrio aggregans TaxID=86166 RepID=A0A0U9HVC2_9BACT|nr:response regulator [Thermodesulfovibrio aggregans]GAQ94637.1 response regulator receiver domain-containing protein [Thermodesulfovibrio aggregans]